ncbi:MAG: PD40 domain-containing protein, partial [Bacteroidota bacterium]|nr:PD40 domain-containing protein [Bacteroidota bacterium]
MKTYSAACKLCFGLICVFILNTGWGQETRLLRQPNISNTQIAFIYGGDVWVVGKNGGEAKRITSTAAVESDPHFSPDGNFIAFTSNRAGSPSVYVVSANGGIPTRITWYPAPSYARGWSADGQKIVYASSRESAPTGFCRLWTVSKEGGPSTLLPAPWGYDGELSADGKKLVVDRVTRWDSEFRHYRGGQNTPIQILDLASLSETAIPNANTTDIHPNWMGNEIYFLSDRAFIMNVWSYNPANGALKEVTSFDKGDVKWLSGNGKELVFEHNGSIHVLDPATGKSKQVNIHVSGDFPWSETKWETVTASAENATLSPSGKRIILEARGDIFTVPVENGDVRNITQSSDAADRRPVWSPDGKHIAWFSDKGGVSYALYITDQEGKGTPQKIDIGESALGWNPVWSPDSKYIAFVDNKVRIQVIEIATGKITTADIGGANIERSNMAVSWSPDSKWLSYTKTAPNNFRQITVWSMESGKATAISNPMADAIEPAWDKSGRYLYFLASTNLALGSGWANTSSMQARPSFGGYMILLRNNDPNPFPLKSDEEPDSTKSVAKPKDSAGSKMVRIDFDNLDRRTLALPIPAAEYSKLVSGPKGTIFLLKESGIVRFTVATKKTEDFVKTASDMVVSDNGEKMLIRSGMNWQVVSTAKIPGPGEGKVDMTLRMELNRLQEWKQIFTEAYRYERDYFYDKNLHGRDWKEVWEEYAPLIPFIRHRSDLTYLLDQLGGELSVGHSFVGGGDFPKVDISLVGVLGADLVISNGKWQIKHIYTTESWNPGLAAPLAVPDLKVAEGDYILEIDGKALNASMDPYALLDGKAKMQTRLLINHQPDREGAWTITVEPAENENALRQRAWVENNRRKVDELSHGKLGYVWVPNTGGPGFVSFNRYYFAQQDKAGAVIDERFNGGGLLDDYMVDLMVRRLRAAATNEVPGGRPFKLPSGILGPKVLLINELAGSGGDFFPWVF